ncbi:hypothetical protein G5B46_05470 [Caulobacter sp. 602-2]|uniref:Uncharacterized protein n=1 Tax=Caulobacter sp. 602-2 TaxID=2710887 RepID=A0A6G4QU33_9CAUL|nr:hypothetical protein [Caulobacter sp. 602-2]NGM49051.1 hypothetical protein [Caulobacter sp. 602-2]
MTSAALMAIGAVPFLISGQLAGIAAALGVGLMTAPFSLIVWMAGVVLIGAPCWAVLHAFNIRSPKAGALLGAILVFVATTGVLLLLTSMEHGAGLWFFSGSLAAIGAIAGWAAALTAYEKDAAC